MHRLISSRLTDRIFIWLYKCAKDIHYYCNKLLFLLKNTCLVSFLRVFVGLKYETGHLRRFLIWWKFHISARKSLKLKILVSTPHNYGGISGGRQNLWLWWLTSRDMQLSPNEKLFLVHNFIFWPHKNSLKTHQKNIWLVLWQNRELGLRWFLIWWKLHIMAQAIKVKDFGVYPP